MQFREGDNFAGYTIERPLGSDGHGETYLVRHAQLPRHDVLRVLPAAGFDEEFRQRFLHDAGAAATVRHPHIVSVVDRGEQNGRLWIATEYVEGKDAAALIREDHPSGISADRVAAIVTAVAAALDDAQQHGLRHGNLTLSSILLHRSADGQERVSVTDFGIPPGFSGADDRSDQYALAVATCQLLTGTPPAHGSNPQLGAVDAPLARALNADPAQRFSSCTEFAQAFTAATRQQPAQFSTAPPMQYWNAGPPAAPAAAPVKRGKGAAITAVLLAVLLLGALALAGLLGVQWQQAAQREAQAAAITTAAEDGQAAAVAFAEILTSIDSSDLDGNFDKVLDGATGEFKDMYEKTSEQLQNLMREVKSTSTGTVVESAVQSATPDQVVVLLFVDQSVSNTYTADPRVDRSRMKMTMDRVDGRWLASKVDLS